MVHLSFFKLSQISEKFSNTFIEKNLHISEPMQFKPRLFKGQLYIVSGAFATVLKAKRYWDKDKRELREGFEAHSQATICGYSRKHLGQRLEKQHSQVLPQVTSQGGSEQGKENLEHKKAGSDIDTN